MRGEFSAALSRVSRNSKEQRECWLRASASAERVAFLEERRGNERDRDSDRPRARKAEGIKRRKKDERNPTGEGGGKGREGGG